MKTVAMTFMFLMMALYIQAEERPNIILVLADDIGISGISCYGSNSFDTPNIDAMADDGIKFNYAFSTPICGPSRVCLMTGRYPFRTGGLTNQSSEKVSPLIELAFPRLLQQSGYATYATGKWPWLGHMDKVDAWGFDETLLWNDRHTTDRYWNPNLYVNGEKRSFPGGYGPDVMQDSILDFIDRVRKTTPEKPFFAYYASALPHKPMIHTPDSKSAELSEGKKYRDMVLYMDKQVGQLREELEKRKLSDNTLIIFTGDNGSISEMKEVINGKPVLGGKAQMTDGGVWVPLICYWQGTIKPGQKTDALIDFSDFFPTILDLAGVKYDGSAKIDGKSFAPLLRGQEHRPRNWVYYQNAKKFALRTHRWKLNQNDQFFDMQNGIHAEISIAPDTSLTAKNAYNELREAMDQLRQPVLQK